MDKIVGIVNSNLKSVINGIREHLTESESLLERINKDMDKKVNQAQDYKEQVIESKTKINRVEDEIDALEKDLNDLNAKFGGTDFKEILSAGNKEINTKIIEKRAVIQRESQRILDLTDKARQLKEDLVDLKDKKHTLEKDIKTTKVVEKFYAQRINDIISYTEAGNDLELYVDNTPQAELMTNNDYEMEQVEISKVLNDHVFEEIDAITSQEPDAELVEEALKNAVKVTYIPREPVKEVEEKKEEVKEETAQEKQPEIKIVEIKEEPQVEETKEEVVEAPTIEDGIPKKTFQAIVTEGLTKKELAPEPVKEEVKEEVKPEIEEVKVEEEPPVQTELVDSIEAPSNEDLSKLLNNNQIVEDEKEFDEAIIDKTLEKLSYPAFDDSSIDLNMLEDDVVEEETTAPVETKEEVKEEDLLPGEETIEISEEDLLPGEETIVNPAYEEDADDSVIEIEIEDDLDAHKNIFKEKEAMTSGDIASFGIDVSKLSEEDINILTSKMDRSRMNKKMNVLKKHNLGISAIYPNVKVLTEVSSENMDKMLTMLENVSKEDLSVIVPVLDKVNVNALEESVDINKDKSLIDIVIPAIDEIDDTIKDALEMTDEEYQTLQSSVSEETFKKLNLLSDRVVENYKVLNGLGINNIRECLTKYPTKLLLDPKEFKEILDKYDQDDLVRCINKNAKVFEKI